MFKRYDYSTFDIDKVKMNTKNMLQKHNNKTKMIVDYNMEHLTVDA